MILLADDMYFSLMNFKAFDVIMYMVTVDFC